MIIFGGTGGGGVATTAGTGRAAEAEAFRAASARLRQARGGGAERCEAAMRVNRQLWQAVLLAVRHPESPLPGELRKGLELIGTAVLREMQRDLPDFEFLIMVNDQVMAGLATYH